MLFRHIYSALKAEGNSLSSTSVCEFLAPEPKNILMVFTLPAWLNPSIDISPFLTFCWRRLVIIKLFHSRHSSNLYIFPFDLTKRGWFPVFPSEVYECRSRWCWHYLSKVFVKNSLHKIFSMIDLYYPSMEILIDELFFKAKGI